MKNLIKFSHIIERKSLVQILLVLILLYIQIGSLNAQPIQEYCSGLLDNYLCPEEPVSHDPALLNMLMAQQSANPCYGLLEFDNFPGQPKCGGDTIPQNAFFIHQLVFPVVSGNISAATFQFRAKAAPSGQTNTDFISFFEGSVYITGANLSQLTEAGGTWNPNQDASFTLNLGNLPPAFSTSNILPYLNDGDLDILIGNETGVDWMCMYLPTIDCCSDELAFCQQIEDAINITTNPDSCKATLNLGDLGNCDTYIEYIDWGPQIDQGPFNTGDMPMYFYPGSGSYEICYLAIELDSAGFICFEKVVCDTITLDCPDCCTDYEAFCDLADQGFTVVTDSILCKVTVTAPQFDSCHWFTTPPHKPGAIVPQVITATDGIWMFNYNQGGVYQICVDVFEGSADGATNCWQKEMCTTFDLPCNNCVCAPPDMILSQSGINYPLSCDPDIDSIPVLPCPADLVSISGFFGCVDSNGQFCQEETSVDWTLVWADSIIETGTATNFSVWIFQDTLVNAPGLYCLTLSTICPGTLDTCICKLRWIREECDPCCTDSIAFLNAAANVQTNGTLGDCTIHFNATGLDSCMQITYDWGDNQPLGDGPYNNNTEVWYTYTATDTYNVCYNIEEVDADGEVCWNYEVCDSIYVICDSCCTTLDAFCQNIENAVNITVDNDFCKATVNIGDFDSCNNYIEYIDWGVVPPQQSQGPFTSGAMPMHVYSTPGTYIISYLAIELDIAGFICFEKIVNDTIQVQCPSPPDTCIIAPDGLISWWPMDEQFGATYVMDEQFGATYVLDIKGGYNGTPKPGGSVGIPNGPGPVPGKVAGALHFVSPGNTHLEVNDTPALNFGEGSFSIDAWINTDMGTQTEPIVDKLGSLNSGYSLSIEGSAPYYLTLQIGTSGGPIQYLQGPAITTGQWNFVAVSVNPQVQSATFYVGNSNGFIQLNSTLVIPTSASNNLPLLIGKNPFNPHWNIMIDELEIFNRSLDSIEVYSIWNANSFGKCKDTIVDAVTNLQQAHKIRVFPNPTTGELTLHFEDAISKSGQLQIIDLWGRTVMLENLVYREQEHHILIDSLPTGIYFVKVMFEGVLVWVEKVVKQ